MRGILDFVFDNVKENNEMKASSVIIGDEQISIKDFISRLNEYEEPIMFVRHLEYTFRLLENELLKAGYICKYCKDKGKGYHHWSRRLKEKEYTPMIFGADRRCIQVKFANFKMYDAERWLGTNRDPFQRLTGSEKAYLYELSKNAALASTPSSNAWKNFRQNVAAVTTNNQELYWNIEAGLQGGIIEGIPGYYKHAYHYDITSLYPYILSLIERFPCIDLLKTTTADEIANHNKYAYWILSEDGQYHCDVDVTIVPAGSIKSPLLNKNIYKDMALSLYERKSNAKKGTCEYTIAKLEANSFIGRIIKKNYMSAYYPYCNNDIGVIKQNHERADILRHIEEYTYLIARARSFMKKKVAMAKECGANIIQINTDGFFTDKPIPYDEERFLGSLRFEYETHDLTIFACNQYVCSEEVCIAGLPKSLYVPGQKEFRYPILSYNHKTNRVEYMYKKLTLGEN